LTGIRVPATLDGSMRSRWRRVGLALVVLAAAGVLSFEDYLPHTDDGCAVETHCAVCASHIGTAAVSQTPTPVHVAFDVVGFVAPEAVGTTLKPAVPASASRGPPLA
jgi:hypothetical protein